MPEAIRFATRRRWLAVALLVALLPAPLAATDYSSNSFILRDPVVTVGGTRSTSGTFQYFGSTGQTTAGQSSNTFIQRAGFLYFPVATASVVTATAGDTSASLSWTAATAELGYTISAYEVGQSTVSGSGYGYTNVGNVLSSTRSSLTNGTAYYFVVRALDSLGDAIATSTEVTTTPVASAATTPGDSGSGGGGGAGPILPAQVTRVVLNGTAYPNSPVLVLRDGQLVSTIVAGSDATFTTTLSGLTAGTYQFGVSSEDRDGRRSVLVVVPVTVRAGTTTRVAGLYLPPTIAADKLEVRQGEELRVLGQSAPGHEVVLVGTRERDEVMLATVTAGADGMYAYRLDTARLQRGTYRVRSKATFGGVTSGMNSGVSFVVGDTTVVATPQTGCSLRVDFNQDCRVNIIDFSILVYWFDQPNPPTRVELSGDGAVDLVDFSVLVYYWTG